MFSLGITEKKRTCLIIWNTVYVYIAKAINEYIAFGNKLMT